LLQFIGHIQGPYSFSHALPAPKATTYALYKMNRAFKVIHGHPYCRNAERIVVIMEANVDIISYYIKTANNLFNVI